MTYFVGNSTVNSSITATTASIVSNSTSTALFVAANGNIGISNASPSVRLHVEAPSLNGVNYPYELIRLSYRDGPSSAFDQLISAGLKISWHTPNDNNFGNTSEAAYITSIRLSGAEGVTATHLAFGTDDSIVAGVSNIQERMRITSAGDVGIGNSSPTHKLHAYSSDNILCTETSAAGESTMHTYRRSGTTKWQWNLGGSDEIKLYNAMATDFPIVISNTGNLGIGLAPTARNNTSFQIKNGIGFPATQIASSDANTLDDYEEGSWTPTLGGSTTYTQQSGTYVKIGRFVYINFIIQITAINTPTSQRITGLPFAYSSPVARSSVSLGYFTNLAIGTSGIYGNIDVLGLYFNTATAGGTAITGDPASIFGNGTYLIGSGHYVTTT